MNLYHMDDNTLLIAEPVLEPGFSDPLKILCGLTAVVRFWGTTRGRGELAIDGPTEKTIVDPEPPGGEINWLHVRRVIPVTEKAGAKWLALLMRC